MTDRNWTGFLVAVVASAFAIAANAQTSQPLARPDISDIYAFGKTADRSSVIASQALDNPALNLASSQRAEINKIIDTYLEEQQKLGEKFPLARGELPSAEAILARQAVVVTMTTALTRVLNPEQLKAWREGQAAQRRQRDPGWASPSGR